MKFTASFKLLPLTVRLAVAALALMLIAAIAIAFLRPGLSLKQERVDLLDAAQVIVLRTPGGLLEVASLRRTEEFGWQTSYTCPLIDCGKLLGATVTRVRVPVVYTYRVPLGATWELHREGELRVLRVPQPEPALPPAIDAARIELQTQGSWTSPGRELNVQSTLRQLGPELSRRASQPAYLRAQEEAAAATVREFARKWMAEQQVPDGRSIRVEFGPPATPPGAGAS